jgi:hypothetical protein
MMYLRSLSVRPSYTRSRTLRRNKASIVYRSMRYLLATIMVCYLQTTLSFASSALAVARPASQDLLECTITYKAPFSEEVVLVWGINNWKLPDSRLRPTGSEDDGHFALTPLQKLGDHLYGTKIFLPPGTTINFAFHTTETIELWDGDPQQGLGYSQQLDRNYKIDNYQSVVTQAIHYRIVEADEVFLVWGINKWGIIPESFRPKGTIVDGGLMVTPMVRSGDVFAANTQVPEGATIDYVFLITKMRDGTTTKIWDANGNPKRDYHTIATGQKVAEVRGVLSQIEDQAPTPDNQVYQYVLWGMIGIGIVCGLAGILIPLILFLSGKTSE